MSLLQSAPLLARRQMAASLSLAAYVAVFGVLAYPWLREAAWSQPETSPLVCLPSDARLIVFVLSWISRTLWTDPARLFDLPIFHPAPAQLAGTEHFLAAQLLYTPLFTAIGEPVTAATWTAFLLYPLGAFAMERLARRLGASAPAAWLAGLVFALGPLRVPAHLQTLQYPNVFLALVYWAVVGLRDRPGPTTAAALLVALAAGVLSSYYMAATLAVVVAAAVLLELAPAGRAHRRSMFYALAAGAVAYGVLLVVSQPYFGRLDVATIQANATTLATLLSLTGESFWLVFGVLDLLVVLLGVLALTSTDAERRHLACAGIVCVALGLVLALGPTVELAGTQVPLPYAAFAYGPTSFLRVPMRFAVIAGLGAALLVAAGFDHVARARSAATRAVAFAIVLATSIVLRGLDLPGTGTAPLASPSEAAVFRELALAMETGGGGPVLELPALDRMGALDSDAMMHALIHHAPLATGYTGHPPAHIDFLRGTLARLRNDPGAIDDLVDATHVRWLVLKPSTAWLSPRERARYARVLAESGAARVVRTIGEWTLLRLEREPEHPAWFAALRAGPRPGHTALGTPLEPLDLDAFRAALSVVTPATRQLGRLPVTLELRNIGTASWPVSAPDGAASTVALVAEWRPAGATAGPPNSIDRLVLPRDVAPGDAVRIGYDLAAGGGPATVAFFVEQRNGSVATDRRSPPLLQLP